MSTVNIRVSFICSGLINLLTEFFVEEVENLISFWVVDLCLMLWSDVNKSGMGLDIAFREFLT